MNMGNIISQTTVTTSNPTMGVIESDSGCIAVENDFFHCTFFLGHMFPVRFKSKADHAFPLHEFRDNLVDVAGKACYYLNEDRWTLFEIIENSAEKFIIDCIGTFCRIDSRPDMLELDGVKVVYQYTITKHSSLVMVRGKLSRETVNSFDFNYMQMSWRGAPFRSVITDAAVAAQDFTSAEDFGPAARMTLSDGRFHVSLASSAVTLGKVHDGRYRTWMHGGTKKGWNTKNFTFDACLGFETK